MAFFTRRREKPKVAGGYSAFRPYVREDFLHLCAYCLLDEVLAGGEENFELDHFRPRKLFPELFDEFLNIYYACHPCNRIKWDFWPAKALQDRGVGFVSLCEEDFVTHFKVTENCLWEGVTPSGSYTVDTLRLNRKHLLTVRRLLQRLGLAVHEGRVDEERLRQVIELFHRSN